jgi:MFS family permease
MTSALSAVLLGRASDKIGFRRMLLFCGAAAGLLYGAMAFVRTPAQLALARALAGVATGGILASASALQASLAPKGRFGAVYGINTSLMAASSALSPMIGATLTANWGLSAVFVGAAVTYAAATVVAAALVPMCGLPQDGAASMKAPS